MRAAAALLRVGILIIAVASGDTKALAIAPNASIPEWASFLLNPNRANCERLSVLLRDSGRAECAYRAPTPKDVVRLAALVEQGNVSAVDVAFLSFVLLDGGELEDLLRAVATLSSRNPRLLLKSLATHDGSDDRIRDLVIMLPASTVDHVAEQRRILRSRRRALEGVEAHGDQMRIRRVALAALERELAALPAAE